MVTNLLKNMRAGDTVDGVDDAGEPVRGSLAWYRNSLGRGRAGIALGGGGPWPRVVQVPIDSLRRVILGEAGPADVAAPAYARSGR